MHKLKRTITLCGIGIVFLGQGQSLSSLVEQALQDNPELVALYAKSEALRTKEQQVALPDPVFSVGYAPLPLETRLGPQHAKLSVNQSFPWFGTLKQRRAFTSLQASALLDSYQNKRAEIAYRVKMAYYQLYWFQTEKRIVQEHLIVLKELEDLLTLKGSAALATNADMLSVQLEKEELRNTLFSLRQREKKQRAVIAGLINQEKTDVRATNSLPIAVTDTVVNRLWEGIEKGNYELKMLDQIFSSYEHLKLEQKKKGLPNITVGADYFIIGKSGVGGNDAGRDALIWPRVGVTLPLFHRKKYRAMQQEALFDQQAVQANREALKRALQEKLKHAVSDYLIARHDRQLYEKQVLLTLQILKLHETEYMVGQRNHIFESILQLKRKLLTYRLEQQKAIVKQNQAVALLDYMQGQI